MRMRVLANLALVVYALSHAPINAKAAEAPGIELPKKTGPFKVGRTSYHLVDSSRKEIFTEAPDDVRELMVTVHYPAEVAAGQPAAPYADAALAAAISAAYHKPASFFNLLHSHAVENGACIPEKGGHSVVVFSPGFKSHPLFYTAMLEELASQGFVVVSVSHPYSTGAVVFPDGRVVRANDEGTRFELDKKTDRASVETMIGHRDAIGGVWLADVRFVLDSLERLNKDDPLLAGQLDLSRVGICGHSFGGATAAAAVQSDQRFRAGINLDGTDFSSTLSEQIRDSVLWLCSEPPEVSKMPPPRSNSADNKAQADGAEPSKRPVVVSGDPKAPQGARIIRKGPDGATAPPPDPSKLIPQRGGPRIPPGSQLTLTGFEHQAFETDTVLLKSSPLRPQVADGQRKGAIDGRRAVFVVNSLVSGFFRKHLRGETVTFLDDPTSEFPEAIRGENHR